MADKKISALTGAATPLAGTEVLPIVQSGTTVKVSVDNLTTGKTVNGSNFIAGSSFGAGGTTPTVGWNTAVFQTQNAAFNSNNGQDLRLYQNIYYDGSNYRYITANPGGFMLQYQNETEWFRSTDGSPAAGGVASTTSVVKFTTAGNVNISNGNLVIGTAGKGITTTVTNGDINLIPLGTGVVSSVSDSVFNQIRTARPTKTVARLGTGVLTVTPVATTSTHSSIRVDINVAFTNSTNLQYHAGYLVLTCNQGTGGGGTAIAEYFNGSVGNFVVAAANFVVTRPASGNIVITYTNTNLADPNNIEFAVTGVFASATVA